MFSKKKNFICIYLLTVMLFSKKNLLGYMWASMLVYCTVYDMCVCVFVCVCVCVGGVGLAHQYLFRGPPIPCFYYTASAIRILQFCMKWQSQSYFIKVI